MNLPQGFDFSETSLPTPLSTYGMEKAVCEMILADASRRQWVDGRSVRLPTIVVRPGKPNSAASSFCSSIIREPLKGEVAVCPVDRSLPLWLQSPGQAILNLIHAHKVPLANFTNCTITLPGLTTTPEEMVEALHRAGGDTSLVLWEKREPENGIVSSWPGSIHTPTADAMGFLKDRDFDSIISSFLED
eukprot:TRINITY_DN2613_c0_g1_i4.p1 TRINITY_DN2613_c0_g1~~TRINITY_DN2613_c0_g1_i4.p1  ORF type:complete len:189 (+),score=41.08 TRINITY_DN2613_c0_g1_i4:3-569(+)